MPQPLPDDRQIAIARRDILTCRWCFLLLGAGMFLQVILFVLVLLFADVPGAAEATADRQRAFSILSVAMAFFTTFPAAIVLARTARTSRWRKSAIGLAATVVADVALHLVLDIVVPPLPAGGELSDPLPLAVRVALLIEPLFLWIELWWMVVLLAEFGIACRAEWLIMRTERLSNVLLAGLVVSTILAAWSAPDSRPMMSQDTASQLLLLFWFVLASVAYFWSLYLLAAAGTLARLLVQRSREFEAQRDQSDE